MVILGAKGHALEILDVLVNNAGTSEIIFFDNVSTGDPIAPISNYPIIRSEDELKKVFVSDPNFILGTGNPRIRRKLSDFCQSMGGELFSLISNQSYISSLGVELGAGLNIMHNVVIQPMVTVGTGTLINAGSLIHHQSRIGSFCEIGPGCVITGNVKIGNDTSLGAGVKILPGIHVGDNVIVGAGAVIIKDIPSNVMVAGVPGVEKKRL